MAISSNATGLRPGVCTSTTRPTTPYTGMLIYETDTGYLRVWDGSAWDYLSQKQDTTAGLPAGDSMGLVKVIPTGATNGTVAANGTVTIGNAVSSVTVSGAFSSLYDNYRIIVSGGAGSTAVQLRLQLGSANANYYWSLAWIGYGTSTVSGGTGNGTSAFDNAGYMDTNKLVLVCDLINPNAAKFTQITGNTWFYPSGASVGYGGEHQSATSHTSFVLLPGSGTMTGGTIRVYGYRN